MLFPLRLADLRAAAEAERDATPTGEPIPIGPAHPDAAGSTVLVRRFVATTGHWRAGDVPDAALWLLDELSGRRFAPSRLVLWHGDRLVFEVVMAPPPAGGEPAARWTVVADGSAQRTRRSADVAFLHALTGGGTERLLLRGALDSGPAEGLGVISGPADARRDVLATAVVSMWQLGRRVLVVSPDPVALDAVALGAYDRAGHPAAGVMVRVGVPTSQAVAEESGLSVEAAIDRVAPDELAELADIANECRHHRDGPASEPRQAAATRRLPSETAVATARAVVAEAAALRTAAEANSATAAAAHSAARERLRRIEDERERHRQVDTLVGETRQATAATTASAVGVGRLADELRRTSEPGELEALTRRLLVAAEVAAARLAKRDEIVDRLHDRVGQAKASGVTRSEIERAEQALAAARAAHATAEAAVARAREAEDTARAELKELTDVRLQALNDELDPLARYRAAEQRRRARTHLALDTARVIFTTPDELAGRAELAGQRVDHVFVEQASALPLPTVYLAASRARRAVTLAVDPAQQPPPPACPDPDHHRSLGRSVVDLLGLRGPHGALAAHPHVLVVD